MFPKTPKATYRIETSEATLRRRQKPEARSESMLREGEVKASSRVGEK